MKKFLNQLAGITIIIAATVAFVLTIIGWVATGFNVVFG